MSEAPLSLRNAVARPPTDDDLARAYFELAALGASASGRRSPWPYEPRSPEELVCLCCEMSRHDPRMLGVLIELIANGFDRLHPTHLRRAMQTVRFPQALCVVLDFAREVRADRELTLYARHVCAYVPRLTPFVHFFVDDVRPGTKLASERMGRSLAPYSRWGFLGMERPTVDPTTKRTVGRVDARTRHQILQRLNEQDDGRGFTLNDYLSAIDGEVSRQQARADLIAEGFEPIGHGRGARWQKPRARRTRRSSTR